MSPQNTTDLNPPDLNPTNLSPQIAEATLQFLARVQLQGSEVPAFNQIIAALTAAARPHQAAADGPVPDNGAGAGSPG